MVNPQPLGGARQSSPLEDEMTYPLTNEEYLTIKDNLSTEKFSNTESFLLSIFISTFISGIVIYITGSFYTAVKINNVETKEVNMQQLTLLIIYGAISLGTLIGFIIALKVKKSSRPQMERLDAKITSHLKK